MFTALDKVFDKRIVFLNPHTFHFGKLTSSLFNKRKNYNRYAHLIDLKIVDYEVGLMDFGPRSSFRRTWIRKLLSLPYLANVEMWTWIFINKMDRNCIKLNHRVDELNPQKDIIFAFGVDLASFSIKELEELRKFTGVVFIHMTHYFYDPVGIARSTEYIKNPVFISEGCPTETAFFQKYFDERIPHYQLPFAFSERFVGKSSVQEKVMKCLAVGSITDVFQREFREYYKPASPVLHPMRRVIYQARESLDDVIECRIRDLSNFDSESNPQNRNSTYFQEDLADLYRSHLLFISPEEIVGLPSVNFVDGMSAGTAYIGARDEMYANLGMEEGVHYIAYSAGNLEDLMSKLHHALKNPDRVNQIAQAGFEFAMNHFSPNEVVRNFERIAALELKSKVRN